MPSFNFLPAFLWPGGGGAGYQRPTAQEENGTPCESLNLEDVIDEFDEPSRESKTASFLSISNAGLSSQSYFSLSKAREDETTSFYSALQDGFSLYEYELQNKYGQELLRNGNRERDAMLQYTDFQVSWCHVSYTIVPKVTLAHIWHETIGRLSSAGLAVQRAFNHHRSDSYAINKSTSSILHSGSEPIKILQGINGSFKSSELTAVMGPSGAGKTSLLNFLSRRREDGFTGDLRVSDTNHKISINAIPQHDHLPEYLTVRENITFASRLEDPKQDHEKRIGRVSNLLGLDECLDTRTKSISGGQQKRLAIAQELLTRPDILILDEPTSGLDSITCFKTLSVLKDLVRASAKKIIDPIAIILTIHQPQHDAFNLFDKVYVMANGGIVIYDGPPDKCIEFVEKHAGLKLPSEDYNPASFLIEIASGEYGQEPIIALERQVKREFEEERLRCVQSMSSVHGKLNSGVESKSDAKNANDSIVVERGEQSRSPSKKLSLHLDPRLVKGSSMNKGNFFIKTRILTERCWISLLRDPKQMVARILFQIFLPFGIAFLTGVEPGHANACPRFSPEYSFNEVMTKDDFTSGDVQEEMMLTLENTGIWFMVMYCSISANIAAMTLIFTIDMQSSLKEYYNGWYSMNSYVLARFMANLPLDLILPTITIALTYYATEQNTGHGDLSDVYRVMITSASLILGSCIGQLMGMVFGAIYVGHITTALFASQGATLPFVLLSGFVARTKNMSKFVQLLSITSLYKHILEATFIARYGYKVCECDPSRIKNGEVKMTGVNEELRRFTKIYLDQQTDGDSSSSSNGTDVFQTIAQQISLFNTYGIEIKSCDQMKPYQLYDFGLNESDLPKCYITLMLILIIMTLILVSTVKFVIGYRTSL